MPEGAPSYLHILWIWNFSELSIKQLCKNKTATNFDLENGHLQTVCFKVCWSNTPNFRSKLLYLVRDRERESYLSNISSSLHTSNVWGRGFFGSRCVWRWLVSLHSWVWWVPVPFGSWRQQRVALCVLTCSPRLQRCPCATEATEIFTDYTQ